MTVPNSIVLDITAVSGPGNLLGNSLYRRLEPNSAAPQPDRAVVQPNRVERPIIWAGTHSATPTELRRRRGKQHVSSVWLVSVLGRPPRKLRDNAVAWAVSPARAGAETLQLIATATNSRGSAGPLFNNKDKVIGINFAMVREFGGSNFAIPVGYGKSLLKP